MVRRPWHGFDRSIYRTALRLCPSGFRRAYADDMIRDFAEACDEASSSRAGCLWWLRLAMAVDVARTIVVQWARTVVPVIALSSVTIALALAEGIATVVRRMTAAMPTDRTHDELIGVVLLAATSVVLIAMTIVLTLWVTRLNQRRRRSG